MAHVLGKDYGVDDVEEPTEHPNFFWRYDRWRQAFDVVVRHQDMAAPEAKSALGVVWHYFQPPDRKTGDRAYYLDALILNTVCNVPQRMNDLEDSLRGIEHTGDKYPEPPETQGASSCCHMLVSSTLPSFIQQLAHPMLSRSQEASTT